MNVEYNPVYSYCFTTKARILVLYGGRDSGKSYFVGAQYLPYFLLTDPNTRACVLRQTYASCKDSVYQEIVDGIEALGLSHRFTCTVSPLEIACDNGAKVIFRGLDNPAKIKSLKGINLFWFEEAETLNKRECFDLLILLRGNGYQRMILTYNPIDEEHFTNAMFVDIRPDRVLQTFDDGDKKVWIKTIRHNINNINVEFEALVICSTYDDNHFIDPIRKAVIEELKDADPFLYEVYRKGKYAARGGRILTNIEEVDFKARGWEFNNFDHKGYGQDWGYNHASATLWVAEKDSCLYIFDEIYEYEKDTDEYEEIMRQRGVDKRITIASESAEPDRVKMIAKKGYRIYGVEKPPGSVRAQIDRLKRYDKIYIDMGCKNTLKEAKAWMYKMDKNGKYTDEPVTVFDDAMAALRYSLDLFSEPKKISVASKSIWGL